MPKNKKTSKTAQSAKLAKPSQTITPVDAETAENAISPQIDKTAPLTRGNGETPNLSTGAANARQGANTGLLWRFAVFGFALVGLIATFRGCFHSAADFVRDWREFKEWQRQGRQDQNIGPVFPDSGGALEDWIAASLPATRSAEECAAASRVFSEVADMLDTGEINTRAAACAETIARLQPDVNPIAWNPFLTALYVRAVKDCGNNTPQEVAAVWRRISAAIDKAKRRAAAEALASAVLSAPAAVAVEDNARRPDSGALEEPQDAQTAGECKDGNCQTYNPYNGYGWRWYW